MFMVRDAVTQLCTTGTTSTICTMVTFITCTMAMWTSMSLRSQQRIPFDVRHSMRALLMTRGTSMALAVDTKPCHMVTMSATSSTGIFTSRTGTTATTTAPLKWRK